MRTTPLRLKDSGKLPAGCITSAEAARRLGLSPSSLRVYRCKKLGPPFLLQGRRAIYRVEDVNAYVRQQAEALQREADTRLKRASDPDAAALAELVS